MTDLTHVFGGAFDANTVNPESEFTPIPAGDYLAMIVDSGMKPTKDRTGQYLELTHEIIDGPLKGRKVWARLNLVNNNQTAVDIAKRSFSQICHATGHLHVTDSQQLHNKPVLIRVTFTKADGVKQKNDGNEIKEWKSASGASTPAQGAPAPSGSAAPAPSAGAPVAPWMRGKAA